MTISSSHSSSKTFPEVIRIGCVCCPSPFTLVLGAIEITCGPLPLADDDPLFRRCGSNGGKGGITNPPGVEGLSSSGTSSALGVAGPIGDEEGFRGPIGLGVLSESGLEDGFDGDELEVEGSLLVSWVGGP
jgi:hypothetical protein